MKHGEFFKFFAPNRLKDTLSTKEGDFSFVKMHGSGNDFIFLHHCVTINVTNLVDFIKNISHRQFGIGCDQLLTLSEASDGKNDLLVRIFNSDGSPAGMCGNAMRCLGHMFFKNSPLKKFKVAVLKEIDGAEEVIKVVTLQKNDNQVEVIFNEFTISPEGIVDLGNLHLMKQISKACEKVDTNPHKDYNVNYVAKTASGIFVKTIERGVGPTLCCGTGVCASAIVTAKKSQNLVPGEEFIIEVQTPGTSKDEKLSVSVVFANEEKTNGFVKFIGSGKVSFVGSANVTNFSGN